MRSIFFFLRFPENTDFPWNGRGDDPVARWRWTRDAAPRRATDCNCSNDADLWHRTVGNTGKDVSFSVVQHTQRMWWRQMSWYICDAFVCMRSWPAAVFTYQLTVSDYDRTGTYWNAPRSSMTLEGAAIYIQDKVTCYMCILCIKQSTRRRHACPCDDVIVTSPMSVEILSTCYRRDGLNTIIRPRNVRPRTAYDREYTITVCGNREFLSALELFSIWSKRKYRKLWTIWAVTFSEALLGTWSTWWSTVIGVVASFVGLDISELLNSKRCFSCYYGSCTSIFPLIQHEVNPTLVAKCVWWTRLFAKEA